MTETPNHDLSKPEKGAADWHRPLNGNFDELDTKVEIRDTEANKGDYEPKAGAKYEATDSGAVYHGNGNSWVLTDRRVSSLSVDEAVFSNSDERSGALLIDRNGDYRAVSFLTDEYWTDASDAGSVLQSLVDAIAASSTGGIGEIRIGRGQFNFETPLVLDEHAGTTLSGQSFRQSNSQSSTTFNAGNISSGRGLVEIGDIGNETAPGGGEGCHIENIYMDLGGNHIAGIYNWGQDRVRTSDVKVENVGRHGNGIVYIGSYNSNIVDSYFIQAAFLWNRPLSKSTNSLRLQNVTFNTNNPGHPPLILSSQGTRVSNGLFNGVDGPGMKDGLAVVSQDESLTGILGSDPRVSESSVAANLQRIQISSSSFVTGGDDVSVFNGIEKAEIVSSRFSSSGITIDDFNRLALSGCRFTSIGEEAIYKNGDNAGGVSTISGCDFKHYGSNNGEPAIRFESSQSHRVVVSGNAFRGTNGQENDIVLENNASSIVVTGNWCSAGISASIGSNAAGSGSRDSISKVVGNSSNPVGFSRTTPDLPDGTGESNSVANLNPQGAWVYHDGSGVKINAFGEKKALSVDPNPVFVPRAGVIYFTSSVPSDWDWWWV